ncbi:MAG: hypothetical protein ACOYVF_08295 [Candidatus Zixiibacteriota bacterium]
MNFLRKLKVLVFAFVFIAIFAGAFTIMTSQPVESARCCWVMVCTQNPPIICWEECRPCPPLFP